MTGRPPRVRFAIRDDDVCYHTDAGMLRALYSDILPVCPISFSAIPFVGGFDVDAYSPAKWDALDVQWRAWQTKDVHPIGRNTELVSQLRGWISRGQATVMLHGIHHDLYEFMQARDFAEDVRRARRYLEELFGQPVTVASPPNNSLGRSAEAALAANGFDVLLAFGHRLPERAATLRSYLNFARLLALYIRHGKRYRLTRPLDFGTHREQPCYEIGPATAFESLVAGFEYVLERGGNFVVATHYYHLAAKPALLEMLRALVAMARGQRAGTVEFVTAERLFQPR